MNNNINIFIGTYGHVCCLDHQNGNEIWRTSLPGVGYSPVSCFYEDLRVYCGANGKVFILCSKTGKILAQNEMVGQGYGFITFTTKRTEQNNQQNIQMPQQQFIPQMIPQQQFFIPQMIPQQQIINPQMMIQNPQMIQNQNILMEQQISQPQILPQSQIMQPPFMIPQQQMMQPQLIQLQNLQQPQIMMQPQFIQFPPESNNNNNDNLQPQTINFPQISQISNQNNNNYLKEDEELARLLDLELNGNPQVQRNNNNVRTNNNNIENFIPKQNVPFVALSPKIQNVSVDDLIFVGLNSYVTALNKYNAQEVWKSYISSYSGLPMSIVYSKGKILVGATGNVYCFDSQTGKELWKNSLPGLRYTNVSIITTTNNNLVNHSSPNLYYQGN